jgi:branched-chain amino acid transport system ATP-binding protein
VRFGRPAPVANPAPGPDSEGPPMLELDHVSAGYGPYRALFDVSLTVPAGHIVALLGSNGAGKSTVARTATGLLPPTQGSIRVAGTDVTGQPAYKIARLGVAHVTEGRGVFAKLTVEENLALSFRQRGGRKRVAELLGRAYDAYPILFERQRQAAGTLSGGQQRMLSLAKALVLPPKILVADELCLGLAPLVVDAVYEELQKISHAGTSLLVVEQQVDRVLDIADRAVILEHGSVAYNGSAGGATSAMETLLASRGERPVLLSRKGAAPSDTLPPSP